MSLPQRSLTVLKIVCLGTMMFSVVLMPVSAMTTSDQTTLWQQIFTKLGELSDLTFGQVLGINTSNLSYPALQTMTGESDPSLAFGLEGVVDWTSQMPFLDIFKSSRGWIGHVNGQWGGFTFAQLRAGGYLDNNGWLRSMPSNVSNVESLWDWSGHTEFGNAEVRAGRYVITYDGEGTIRFTGGNIVNQVPGKIVVDVTGRNLMGISISATDPARTGNYIRNIAMVKEVYLDMYEAGELFNPEWIKVVGDARVIRFMDWMKTNNSSLRNYSDYPNENFYNWSVDSGGVPLAVMVKLANEIGADPWFNIPFYATDSFVTQFATYVRNNLDPRLVANVEFSNEVWNFMFEQTRDAQTIATQRYGNNNAGFASYFGQRTYEVMKIWTDIYGPAASSRLKRIAGAFTYNPWQTEQILLAPAWQAADPRNYVAPHTMIDAIAITSYFGGELVLEDAPRTALLAAIRNPQVNAYQWTRDYIMSNSKAESFYQQQQVISDRYNLDMVVYEGGQHVHHAAGVTISPADLTALQTHLSGFVRSTEMADLYRWSWNLWQRYGDGPYMQFVDVGTVSQWGSWGMLASLTDSSPRSRFLMNQNTTVPAWFESRGGEHFQNGRIVRGTLATETLVGTRAEDVMMGLDGEDTLYPGPGDDSVNGGPDEDLVMLRGNRAQYTITPKGLGYVVAGPDGTDYVRNVEILYFEDRSILRLSTNEVTVPTTPLVATSTVPTPTPIPVAVPTVTFTASSPSISVTDSVTLNWTTTNATACTGSGGWTGGLSVSGSRIITALPQTQTYTIVCTGAGGSVSSTITVSVTPIVPPVVTTPPSLTLTANGVSVPANETTARVSVAYNSAVTLNWTAENATRCYAVKDWSGTKTLTGTETISALTADRVFRLICTGPGGRISKAVVVRTIAATTSETPTLTFTAAPITVSADGTVQLSWTATNVNSCTASGDWSGVQPASGSLQLRNLSSVKTYTLTCQGVGGVIERVATVRVSTVPLPTPTFDTDRDSIIDSKDNCPLTSNKSQLDTDKDGLGDVCDPTPNIVPQPTTSTLEAVDDFYVTNKTGPVYKVNVLSNDQSPAGVVRKAKYFCKVPGSNGGVFCLHEDGELYFEGGDSFASLAPTDKKTTSITYSVTAGKATDTGTITVTVSGSGNPF